MIDGVKIRVINTDPKLLLENPLLNWTQAVQIATGEMTGNREAEYHGLRFIIYVSNAITIVGSLHKYMNDGQHNHNDFSRIQLKTVLEDILTKFELNARNCTLVNLEVGANVIPVIPAKELLKYLFLHQRSEFRYGEVRVGTFKQATHREYYLKAYDKGAQYGLNTELFRFEVKMMTSRFINKFGIQNLEGLLKPIRLQDLGNFLIRCWQQVLMYEPTMDMYRIPFNKREIMNDWSNPNYWTSLAQDRNAYRNRMSREVKKYRFYQAVCSLNYQIQMTETICNKLARLLSPA